jgi:hypothetical protein
MVVQEEQRDDLTVERVAKRYAVQGVERAVCEL